MTNSNLGLVCDCFSVVSIVLLLVARKLAVDELEFMRAIEAVFAAVQEIEKLFIYFFF
jgi:hypothetical protein